MDGFGVREFGGADHRGDVEIAFRRFRRADTDRFVSKADVERVAIGFAIDRDRFDTEFFGSADDAQRNLATIGDEDLLEHRAPEHTEGETPSGQPARCRRYKLTLADGKQRLAIFDRLAVGHEFLDELSGGFRLDLIHELHSFNDAEHLADRNVVTNRDKR